MSEESVNDLLKSLEEAFPPSDSWTSGGSRVMTVQIKKVCLWHSAQGGVKAEKGVIESGSFYELHGKAHLPVLVTVYPAANYQEMILDEEEAGFGYCNFDQNESGKNQEVFITLYLDDTTFKDISVALERASQRGELFIKFQLKRRTDEESQTSVYVTRYDLVHRVDVSPNNSFEKDASR